MKFGVQMFAPAYECLTHVHAVEDSTITVRLLMCEASLAMATSNSQRLQANNKPTQPNVEPLLDDHEHYLTDPLLSQRDPEPPWIDSLNNCQAS